MVFFRCNTKLNVMFKVFHHHGLSDIIKMMFQDYDFFINLRESEVTVTLNIKSHKVSISLWFFQEKTLLSSTFIVREIIDPTKIYESFMSGSFEKINQEEIEFDDMFIKGLEEEKVTKKDILLEHYLKNQQIVPVGLMKIYYKKDFVETKVLAVFKNKQCLLFYDNFNTVIHMKNGIAIYSKKVCKFSIRDKDFQRLKEQQSLNKERYQSFLEMPVGSQVFDEVSLIIGNGIAYREHRTLTTIYQDERVSFYVSGISYFLPQFTMSLYYSDFLLSSELLFTYSFWIVKLLDLHFLNSTEQREKMRQRLENISNILNNKY